MHFTNCLKFSVNSDIAWFRKLTLTSTYILCMSVHTFYMHTFYVCLCTYFICIHFMYVHTFYIHTFHVCLCTHLICRTDTCMHVLGFERNASPAYIFYPLWCWDWKTTAIRSGAVREAGVSRHDEGPIDGSLWYPLDHHSTIVSRKLKGILNRSPIMPKNSSVLVCRCEFFFLYRIQGMRYIFSEAYEKRSFGPNRTTCFYCCYCYSRKTINFHA